MTTKLDQLEALSKAASPGPWVKVSDCNRFAVYSRIADMDVVTSQCRRYVASQRDHLGSTKADAELIAAMRNNIDDLIAVARAAQKMIHAEWCRTTYEPDRGCDCGRDEIHKLLEKLK